jgi:hypothetical protein
MISSKLNLNQFTVHQIITQDLDMRKVCAKMVPKNLTTEQKANRRDVCLDLLDRLPVVPQPPYSPDLSPCDLFLFSRLKNHLKGRHLGTLDNIQKRVTDELKGIPEEAFQHCYEQWKQRLRRCVAAQGNYFEGDNLDLLKE